MINLILVGYIFWNIHNVAIHKFFDATHLFFIFQYVDILLVVERQVLYGDVVCYKFFVEECCLERSHAYTCLSLL